MQEELEVVVAENRAAAAVLKAANARFIATLSHELRTPLTPVLAGLDILEQMDLSAEAAEVVEVIRRNAKHQARMLDDLLDVNRLKKEKLHLNREAVDLQNAVQQSVQVVKAEIDAKYIELVIDFGAHRAYVDADPDRLQQVLWNVVKNAVKFTPVSGRIFIGCKTDGRGNVVLIVRDTGVGIKAEVLPTVFEPFEQGERSPMFGGLGLGLSIVKGLMDLHDGAIAVASPGEGAGTTVTLTFPAADAPVKGSNTTTSNLPRYGAGHGILLVEDHPDTLKIMARLLEMLRYRVVTAASVKAALEAAAKHELQLLVSDIGLPDGTGFELMEKLGGKFAGRSIALTGYGMDEDVRRCHEVGFARHLTKPVDFQKLQGYLEELVLTRSA
jgi:CheY-like chemotaxis protein/two-component sensor histidine kinase